ncbi:peptidoglycan bridge formation glycyltransferase FemA/FemB family protein, partial [Candidatus Uhrbacteria bacterium]|nr:peptidoglycan bridge formation glycyltransferase FemA/FemB family protein [Candidatus Uhrbacteria bacterium]
HSWEWGELEHAQGRGVTRLGVFDGGRLVALSLWSRVSARRGTFLLCPHGPLVAPEAAGRLADILVSIREALAPIAERERCSFLRVSTLTPDTPEHRASFLRARFRPAPIHAHTESVWVLDVTPSAEALLAGMRKNTRYAIRRAERDGVSIRMSRDVKDFAAFLEVYEETVARQSFVAFPAAFLKDEFEIFSRAGKAVLIFGSYRENPISAALIVYDAGSGFYHHGGSVQTIPGISASEAVQWAAIQEAKRRGCSRYNFWGIAPTEDRNHPWYGLTKFKQGFGGRLVSYVPTQDLPLTPSYWLTYGFEKMRKMKRGL